MKSEKRKQKTHFAFVSIPASLKNTLSAHICATINMEGFEMFQKYTQKSILKHFLKTFIRINSVKIRHHWMLHVWIVQQNSLIANNYAE